MLGDDPREARIAIEALDKPQLRLALDALAQMLSGTMQLHPFAHILGGPDRLWEKICMLCEQWWSDTDGDGS